jgi:hypothetical protein
VRGVPLASEALTRRKPLQDLLDGEVHRFSVWRAIGASVLSTAVIAVPIGLLFTVLFVVS